MVPDLLCDHYVDQPFVTVCDFFKLGVWENLVETTMSFVTAISLANHLKSR